MLAASSFSSSLARPLRWGLLALTIILLLLAVNVDAKNRHHHHQQQQRSLSALRCIPMFKTASNPTGRQQISQNIILQTTGRPQKMLENSELTKQILENTLIVAYNEVSACSQLGATLTIQKATILKSSLEGGNDGGGLDQATENVNFLILVEAECIGCDMDPFELFGNDTATDMGNRNLIQFKPSSSSLKSTVVRGGRGRMPLVSHHDHDHKEGEKDLVDYNLRLDYDGLDNDEDNIARTQSHPNNMISDQFQHGSRQLKQSGGKSTKSSKTKSTKSSTSSSTSSSDDVPPTCSCQPPSNTTFLNAYRRLLIPDTNQGRYRHLQANAIDIGVDSLVSLTLIEPLEECPTGSTTTSDDVAILSTTLLVTIQVDVVQQTTSDGSLTQAQLDQLGQEILKQFNALNDNTCDAFFRRIANITAQQKFPGYNRRRNLANENEDAYVDAFHGSRQLRNTAPPTLDLSGFFSMPILFVVDYGCRRCPSGTNLYPDGVNRNNNRNRLRRLHMEEEIPGDDKSLHLLDNIDLNNPRLVRSIIEHEVTHGTRLLQTSDTNSSTSAPDLSFLNCSCDADAAKAGISEQELLAALNATLSNNQTNGIKAVSQIQEVKEVDCSDSIESEQEFELLVTIELQVCDESLATSLQLDDERIPTLEQAFRDTYNDLVAAEYCDPFYRVMKNVDFQNITSAATVPSSISGQFTVTIQAVTLMRCRGCNSTTTTLYESAVDEVNVRKLRRDGTINDNHSSPKRSGRKMAEDAETAPTGSFTCNQDNIFVVDEDGVASSISNGEGLSTNTHPFDAHCASSSGPQPLDASATATTQETDSSSNATSLPLIETCYCDAAPIAERSPSESELMAAFNARVQGLSLACISGVGECPQQRTPFTTNILITFEGANIGTDSSSLTPQDISILLDDIVQLIANLYQSGDSGPSNEGTVVCDPSFRSVSEIETTINYDANQLDESSATPITRRYLFDGIDEDATVLSNDAKDTDLDEYASEERQLRTTSRPTYDLSDFAGFTGVNVVVTGSCSSCEGYFGYKADTSSTTTRRRSLHATSTSHLQQDISPTFLNQQTNHRHLNEAIPEEPSTCFCPVGSDEVIIFNVNDLSDKIDSDVDLPAGVTISKVQELLPVECAANLSSFAAEPLVLDLSVKVGSITDTNLQEIAILFRDTYNELTELYCDTLFRLVDTADVAINLPTITLLSSDDGGCVDTTAALNVTGTCRGCVDGQSLVDMSATTSSMDDRRQMMDTDELELDLDPNRKERMGRDRNRDQPRRLEQQNGTCFCTSDTIADRGPFLLELYAALNRALTVTPIPNICGLADTITSAFPPTQAPSSIHPPNDVLGGAYFLQQETVEGSLRYDVPGWSALGPTVEDLDAVKFVNTVGATRQPFFSFYGNGRCLIPPVETAPGVWYFFRSAPSVWSIRLDQLEGASLEAPLTTVPSAFITIFKVRSFLICQGQMSGGEERLFTLDGEEIDNGYYVYIQGEAIRRGLLSLVQGCRSLPGRDGVYGCARNVYSSGGVLADANPVLPGPPDIAGCSPDPSLPGVWFDMSISPSILIFVLDNKETESTIHLSYISEGNDNDCETQRLVTGCQTSHTVVYVGYFPGFVSTNKLLLQVDDTSNSGLPGPFVDASAQFGIFQAPDDPVSDFLGPDCEGSGLLRGSCYCRKGLPDVTTFDWSFDVNLSEIRTADPCFNYDGCSVDFELPGRWFAFTIGDSIGDILFNRLNYVTTFEKPGGETATSARALLFAEPAVGFDGIKCMDLQCMFDGTTIKEGDYIELNTVTEYLIFIQANATEDQSFTMSLTYIT